MYLFFMIVFPDGHVGRYIKKILFTSKRRFSRKHQSSVCCTMLSHYTVIIFTLSIHTNKSLWLQIESEIYKSTFSEIFPTLALNEFCNFFLPKTKSVSLSLICFAIRSSFKFHSHFWNFLFFSEIDSVYSELF